MINWPNAELAMKILSICYNISKHQAVTDLYMDGVRCDKSTPVEAPVMSREARALFVFNSTLPWDFLRNTLRQLHHCVTLQRLHLWDTDLQEVEEDINDLLEHIVPYHEAGLAHTMLELTLGNIHTTCSLSPEFVEKWIRRCEGIRSIRYEITAH